MSVSCFGFTPIFPTSSLILVLPKFFAPRFWKLMPCVKQFLLRAGSPRCTCPCQPHSEPSMGSRTIPVPISGTFYIFCKGHLNWYLCQSMFFHIPKTQTHSITHNPSLWLCEPYLLPMFQLYIPPHECVYSCLGSLCRHKQNTTGTSVRCCSYTEALDETISWDVETYISIFPLYPKSVGQSATTYTFA